MAKTIAVQGYKVKSGAFLQCTYKTQPCGCQIIGDGSLLDPLDIERCKKHSN